MQELGDEFLLMVGNCITEWAAVEEQLFEICRLCLGCPRDRAAIVYYRTPSIDARLSLADELVKAVLPKRTRKNGGRDHPDLRHWRELEKKFRALLPTRNRIAHHPVAPRVLSWGDLGAAGIEAQGLEPPKLMSRTWFEVYTSQNEQLRERSANQRPLRIDGLRSHFIATSKLMGALHQFRYVRLPPHISAPHKQVRGPIVADVEQGVCEPNRSSSSLGR